MAEPSSLNHPLARFHPHYQFLSPFDSLQHANDSGPNDSDLALPPLGDQNSWYYPSHGHDSDEESLPVSTSGGNWGNKTARGARWVRRGKITSWGPAMGDWEAEDRARRRVKSLLPAERRSPSPPTLPHLLRSPSPPTLAPYPAPATQHLSFTSFVMDKSVVHSFRSNLINELEGSTNSLIEGEVVMRRALGRLWQVISEDPDESLGLGSVVPKREDEDEEDEQDDQARRIARAPDLTPAPHKLFLSAYPDGANDHSHFLSPPMQLETLEKSLATLRELQDDGREYVERLHEIREGLGDIRANRDGMWNFVRERAIKELQDVALTAAASMAPIAPLSTAFFTSLIRYSHRYEMMDNSSIQPPIVNGTNSAHRPMKGAEDHELKKWRTYTQMLPYSTEPASEMIRMLDYILLRLTQCIEAKDYEVGLLQWDTMISHWFTLRYPMPKDRRIKLAKIYYHLSSLPGMPTRLVATCSDTFKTLTKSKKKFTVKDMRLPWRPIYDILQEDLFLSRRQFEYTQLSWCMGYLAEHARRFFHPAAIEDMLNTFLPLMDGTKLDSLLYAQYCLVTFLPLSHPQIYLPSLMQIWESVNSNNFDERMIDFLGKLAEMHVVPEASDPRLIEQIPDDARSEGEARLAWSREMPKDGEKWKGIFKDVGIFTDHEWQFLMSKCIAAMGIPIADGSSLNIAGFVDQQATFELSRLPKSAGKTSMLARIIVYSMATDGLSVLASNAPTPIFTPLPSGMSTPNIQTTSPGDYLSRPIGLGSHDGRKPTYLAGSKALDSLAKLIASTETFFHPNNTGSWTAELSAFIADIVYDFNKRWYAEQQPDCKTPRHRRLTRQMRQELVKSLRTVVLLAIFSQDSRVTSNIISCLKSMAFMEPELILQPILERAVPSLEALTETQRTIAMIRALGAVSPAIACRGIYYPGAKNLVPLLQLLIPGIDLNDPSKTSFTTGFLTDVSQYVLFGDLTTNHTELPARADTELGVPPSSEYSVTLDSVEAVCLEEGERVLTNEEEDALLKVTTGAFADWVTSLIRRIIQLMENLPEEGPNGTAGGASEVQMVDAVTGAFNQICIHLSEPLYDLVLKTIYDYASTNVRSNAVRAIHQLVECVATANPEKTMKLFIPFCCRNIKIELESGASSVRTTSSSSPIPSDATLHWNLAMLRGAVYNDGRAALQHQESFMSILRLLHDKTFTERGYSWSGRLLSSLLLTLTLVYPLETKLVNPEEWSTEEFRRNHHLYWGKLYKRGEVKIAWHVPNDAEINFVLRIFEELIEPILNTLDGLLAPDVIRDALWRNEFCRHLSFVQNAFAGIPTLIKEHISPKQAYEAAQSSDILNEIPEMIASVPPISSGFCLTDPEDHRYQYINRLKHRFGTFLHKASVALRSQGEENTLDAVNMLITSIRTFMLEYGDSKDSYFSNEDHFLTEMAMQRLHAGQKTWSRAIWIRKARYIHSARVRWNSIERFRGPLQDKLVDELVQWCMWHYPVIRESSQSLLDSICGLYDGVKRRALPTLYQSLKPGSDDDSMKGALWTLSYSSFNKYIVGNPTLLPELASNLLQCHHNEKPSIQDCVTMVAENSLHAFLEPNFLYLEVQSDHIERLAVELRAILDIEPTEPISVITKQCHEMRIERVKLANEAFTAATNLILEVALSPQTHWRYALFATRSLRTLLRRDVSPSAEHATYFLERIYADHPSIYAQRGLMKAARNIKLRTYCKSPEDLALGRSTNPLKRHMPIVPSHELTEKILADYKRPVDLTTAAQEPTFRDRDPPGWLVHGNSLPLYMLPPPEFSVLSAWETESQPILEAMQQVLVTKGFWERLVAKYSEETSADIMTQDHVSCIKSIFQLFGDVPLPILKPLLAPLIDDKDRNKQRALAECLAGVIGGSKHWPASMQNDLWKWIVPIIPIILKQNLTTEGTYIWSSFLEYLFYHKDPRRLVHLTDYIIEEFKSLDFSADMSFDVMKVLALIRPFYIESGWKFTAWADEVLERFWCEIDCIHDDVRASIAEYLGIVSNLTWRPQPSTPTAEVFVKECRMSLDNDIMGVRSNYHQHRVKELVDKFHTWRAEREPGLRARQSTYDKVGATVCIWLFVCVHCVNARCSFDHILPLLPELFRFTEVNDNDTLVSMASNVLKWMCGVTPPSELVDPILDCIFEVIRTSTSWKAKVKALPILQVFYFRQIPLISDYKIVQILEVVCSCLDDEVIEVREMAATTLTGILRLSPRRSVLTLKERFVRLDRSTHIPDRKDPKYGEAIRKRHAAILGICALVESYPYTIEKWIPDLLTRVLVERTYDPVRTPRLAHTTTH
ncbi:hypothetical protein AX16_005641 [Volvariella volvacea WC 439]|nr:hypothetical protein AX16_005641 [Volvariella volvacea WC 439]